MAKQRNEKTNAIKEEIVDEPFGSGPGLEPNEHGENWLPDIYMLEQSRSAAEFYSRLAELIRHTGKFSEEERRLLAEQAAIPWKEKSRGRPPEKQRNEEIFWKYIFDDMGPLDQPKRLPSRQEAIKLIMKDYNLAADAARKAFDRAQQSSGQWPSITRIKV